MTANVKTSVARSEFALPGEMRETATRIVWDLIKPCRQSLKNAENKRDLKVTEAKREHDAQIKVAQREHDARMIEAQRLFADQVNQAQHDLESVEAEIRTMRESKTRSDQETEAKVQAASAQLAAICQAAAQHLKDQKIATEPPPLPASSANHGVGVVGHGKRNNEGEVW